MGHGETREDCDPLARQEQLLAAEVDAIVHFASG